MQLTTSDIGYFIQSCLGVCSEEGIEKIAIDDETPNFKTDHSVRRVDTEDPENLKVHLSNGQVFTIRIIAGDR